MATFDPVNDLERALAAASTDPAGRPAFYRRLVKSQLLVIDRAPLPTGPKDVTLEAGSTLRLDNLDIDGVPHVPVFSSVEAIQQVVSEQVKFVSMRATDLFGILRDAHVILNPGLAWGKQFPPHEIAAILDGSIFVSRTHVVEEPTQILLGPPGVYPAHLTEPLAAFFATRPNVLVAYLAQYVNPATGEPPHLLIGMDCLDAYDSIVGEAQLVLQGAARPGDVVDIIQLDDSGLSQYMTEETEPFYTRAPGAPGVVD